VHYLSLAIKDPFPYIIWLLSVIFHKYLY